MSTRKQTQTWVVIECDDCQCEVDRVSESFFAAVLRDWQYPILCEDCNEKRELAKVQR